MTKYSSSLAPSWVRLTGLDMSKTSGNLKRVLVVTPDPLLATTRVALVEAAGFPCEAAPNGDDAMKLLRAGEYDLLVLGREYDRAAEKALEKLLHDKFPKLLTLKIKNPMTTDSEYATQTVDPSRAEWSPPSGPCLAIQARPVSLTKVFAT